MEMAYEVIDLAQAAGWAALQLSAAYTIAQYGRRIAGMVAFNKSQQLKKEARG